MKKIYPICLSIAVSLVACNKIDNPSLEKSRSANIKFTATVNNTKTVFGNIEDGYYPTLWTGNETVLVQCNGGDVYEATVTPSTSGLSAEFEVDPDLIPKEDKEYQFFAYSPKSAINNFDNHIVSVLSTQAPLNSNSVDEAAHILVGTSEVMTEKPTEVEMSFDHLLAYGKITLKNFDENVTITSVAMETDTQITGPFTHDPSDGSLNGSSLVNSHKKVVIEANNLTGANADKAFWFAIAPVNLEGSKVTFTVYTNKGEYVKQVTFPEGAGNFEAGKVAKFSLNMSGVERHAVYTLISPSRMTIGSLVVIGGTDSYQNFIVMGTEKRPTYNTNRYGVPFERADDGSIVDPADNIQIFELVPGLYSETVMFKCVNGDFAGKYLSTSFNQSNGTATTTLLSVTESSSQYTSGLTSFTLQTGGDSSYQQMSNFVRIKSNGPTSGASTTVCTNNYISPWGNANGTDQAFFYCKSQSDARKYIGVYKLGGTGHGPSIANR